MRGIVVNVLRIIGLATFCFITVTYADFTDGLVAYYPFSGNADDASGNEQHGVVTGATLTTDRFGNSAAAYRFDGVDDYISARVTELPYGNAPRTLTAWLMPTRAVVNDAMLGVVVYGAGNNHTLFGLALNPGETPFFWGGYADFYPKMSIPVGTWSFVAVTYRNSTIEMMVNGIVATPTASLLIPPTMESCSLVYLRSMGTDQAGLQVPGTGGLEAVSMMCVFIIALFQHQRLWDFTPTSPPAQG
jgi:hypothetical protein